METIIKPKSNFFSINFSEIWLFRELFYIFAWRDIKVRYKQTLLGISWVLFQPLITTIIFTFFLQKIITISTTNLPYPVFVLIGLVYWNFFSSGLTHISNVFIENENIVKKVYFPKIILPVSAALTSAFDFLISLLLVILVLVYFKIVISLAFILMLLIGALITLITILGIGLILSSLNIKYRDVRYILPFFIQLFLFVSPIIYPSTIIEPKLRFFLAFNPMTGVIESVRAAATSTPNFDYNGLLISALSGVVLFLIGLIYFRKTEMLFADIL